MVEGHLAPVRKAHASVGDGCFDDGAGPRVPFEKRCHRVLPTEQPVWDLDQQAGAVATLAVSVETATVGEARQRVDPESHRLMAELRGGDEAHAAGRAGRGEVPGPGKARAIQRWGH